MATIKARAVGSFLTSSERKKTNQSNNGYTLILGLFEIEEEALFGRPACDPLPNSEYHLLGPSGRRSPVSLYRS